MQPNITKDFSITFYLLVDLTALHLPVDAWSFHCLSRCVSGLRMEELDKLGKRFVEVF